MNAEEWKDIKGYEGRYQISTMGRIRSLQREVCGCVCRIIPETVLKFQFQHGYHVVFLRASSVKRKYRVHQLVAQTFIENSDPENKIQVNHKDKNRINNRVTNLEWCTNYENAYHRDNYVADEPF